MVSFAAVTAALLAASPGATLDVPAGASLAAALSRAGPGDVIRLGPGTHAAALGRLAAGVTVEGAGPAATALVAPEGEDGATVAAAVALRGLAIVAGRARCGVRVESGALRLEDVAISGGACGLDAAGGSTTGERVDVRGNVALRVRGGVVSLRHGTARGAEAGVMVLGGAATLARYDVGGPAREAAVSVAGGTLALADVTVRGPGATGIAVGPGGTIDGRGVLVAGASVEEGFPGACVLVRRGALTLRASALAACGAAALQASGGRVVLEDVEAAGGDAGCFLLEDRAEAELTRTACGGRGPAVAAAGGARARLSGSRFRVDPVFWVDCGSGARIELGPGEGAKQPCAAR